MTKQKSSILWCQGNYALLWCFHIFQKVARACVGRLFFLSFPSWQLACRSWTNMAGWKIIKSALHFFDKNCIAFFWNCILFLCYAVQCIEIPLHCLSWHLTALRCIALICVAWYYIRFHDVKIIIIVIIFSLSWFYHDHDHHHHSHLRPQVMMGQKRVDCDDGATMLEVGEMSRLCTENQFGRICFAWSVLLVFGLVWFSMVVIGYI